MTRRLMRWSLALAALVSPAWAGPDPAWRAPDPWSLQQQRLQPRALFEQLEAPRQAHRLTRGGEVFVAAADGTAALLVPLAGAARPPWHGYYMLDLHAAVRAVEGLDVNLELLAFQVSASDGYHRAAQVSPGLSMHWYGALLELGDQPVRGDLVGLELGEITIGHGLLVERVYAEGLMGRLTWGGWELEQILAGQTTFQGDDLHVTRLSWRDVIRAGWVNWVLENGDRAPHYLNLSGALPGLGSDWRIAWEAAGRISVQDQPAAAGLLRLDWRPAHARAIHIGYQGRAYQQGFGPWGDKLVSGYDAPAMPWREDTYVTNALDYLTPSALYHQWSHTVMVESLTRLSARTWLDLNLEGRAWFFNDPSGSTRYLPRPGALASDELPLMPETQLDLHARLWLRVRPFKALPHRLRAGVANTFTRLKSVHEPLTPTNSRLDLQGWSINLEMEVFL